MLFNSFSFAIFLPIVFLLYWALPHRFRWLVLLISSYYFYMSWNVKYVVLILGTTFISYITALLLEKTDNPTIKKLSLATAAIISLGVLFFFKYFNFFQNSLIAALNVFAIKLHPTTLNLLLPVGISFYTFQTLAYVIDVYKGDVRAERHFGKYATFISFFPQLVAGPIERTSNLLPQINREHHFNYDKASYGMKLMVWGFFKKLVIADVFASYVDKVYDAPHAFKGFALILATLFFTIQIYCDFSGYSDIAVGCAKLLDIDLMQNFKSPYFSASIKEFWSRWHISLSTWFKDYVYIPLGGNRRGKLRTNLNLIITFLVSGLWHGANWTFVIWGAIHGFLQVIEKSVFKNTPVKKYSFSWVIRVIIVFCICSFAWIFFRANTLREAGIIISNLFYGLDGGVFNYLLNGFYNIGFSMETFMVPLLSILILAVYDFCSLKTDVIAWVSSKHIVIRYSVYLFMLVFIMLFKASGEAVFVYFQF